MTKQQLVEDRLHLANLYRLAGNDVLANLVIASLKHEVEREEERTTVRVVVLDERMPA